MATIPELHAEIAGYKPWHVTAAVTLAGVGLAVATTSATTITAGAQTVTPASMVGIVPGMWLNFANGTGAAEDVQVSTTTATTFSATFLNGHSGAYTISSRRGSQLGPIWVGNPGTTCVLTLYNGNPNISPAVTTPGTGIIGALTLSSSAPFYPAGGSCDQGLFYKLTGSGADITIWYRDEY